jgi:hypothetical protein
VPADPSQAPVVGPPVRVVYSDTSHQWRTIESDLVRLHWYDGSEEFARRALAIGEKAIRDAETFLGVTQVDPVDFFVYADRQALYRALGPGTRENVGAESHPDIRTVFAWIGPDAPTVGVYVTHEMTHLVFDTAVRNPYHYPPRWLNEGVAVYLSEGYGSSDRGLVEAAASGGRMIPLQALGGKFPTATEGFYQAYAESVAAVDFLIRKKGTEALASLVRSYADGVTDDEAFKAAVGTDLAGFEKAWLDDLGAVAPVQRGPQPAPAGPLPAGWDAGAASLAPGATVGPGMTPSPEASPSPADANADGSPLRDGGVLAGVALAGLLVGGSIAYVRRRRAASGPATPDDAGPPADPGTLRGPGTDDPGGPQP